MCSCVYVYALHRDVTGAADVSRRKRFSRSVRCTRSSIPRTTKTLTLVRTCARIDVTFTSDVFDKQILQRSLLFFREPSQYCRRRISRRNAIIIVRGVLTCLNFASNHSLKRAKAAGAYFAKGLYRKGGEPRQVFRKRVESVAFDDQSRNRC